MDVTKYPAFHPRTLFEGKDFLPKDEPGVTLLDFFAAHAMPVVIKAMAGEKDGEINPYAIGMVSYSIALGMLAAREQPEEAFKQREPVPEAPKLVVP
jgi:hypothetical protein